MGSGHILVYAFDVLVQIYKDAGHREKDCPELILKSNLFGLDIDDRAYQLAYFAVMMSAWRYNHRILTKRIEPNLAAIQESNGLSKWSDLTLDMSGEQQLSLDSQFVQLADELIEKFQDAKEYGSILDVEDKDYEALLTYVKDMQENNVLDLSMAAWLGEVAERLPQLVKQAKIMGQKYDIVVTNPPYMGSNGMNKGLLNYIRNNFPDSKSDFYSIFIEICLKNMLKENRYMGMMTSYTWMFLSSFKKLRKYVLEENHIVTLVQPEYHSFFEEANVPICGFVVGNNKCDYVGEYVRLEAFTGAEKQEPKYLEAVRNVECDYRYSVNQRNFILIPDMPIAYWLSSNIFKDFEKNLMDSVADLKQGLITGDNESFLRNWAECDKDNISCELDDKKKWHFYHKGGLFRKWYGNISLVVDWGDDGFNIINFRDEKGKQRSRPQNIQYYFREGFTWTALTIADFNVRYLPQNSIFDAKGSSGFVHDINNLNYVIGFCNSKVCNNFLSVISPTMDYNAGVVAKVPFLYDENKKNVVDDIVGENIELSKSDWNSSEVSWEFDKHPLLNGSTYISEAYATYKQTANQRFTTMKSNEEELNRIFIDIYGLTEELTPEVAEKDVTVARIYDTKDDIPDTMKGNNYVLTKADVAKSLLSYAVGCMFGRYSLDEHGLIMAGGEFDHSKSSKSFVSSSTKSTTTPTSARKLTSMTT